MKRLALFFLVAVAAFGQATFPEAWPSYNGDYSGRRYSTLAKINQSNINSLSLAWVYRVNPGRAPQAGGGNVNTAIKGTPVGREWRALLHDSRPRVGHRRAHRARDLALRVGVEGRLAHRQSRRGRATRNGCTSKRRTAIWSSLNLKDGKERWHTQICDLEQFYYGSVAPDHRQKPRDYRCERRRSGHSRLH